MDLMKRIPGVVIIMMLSAAGIFAQNGKISGRVLDKSTNEPLPFTNIIIDGTDIGSVSDINGKFLFTGVQPGFVRLKATFVGYKPGFSPDIQVTNANVAYVEIFLEPVGTDLKEIVVTASPFEKVREAPLSMQRIGLADIETNPGSNRDISKVIQSLPGVGFIPTFRNDIIIRGGGPSENVFYLDDVEIPNINHFATQGASGGAIGIINADLLSSVNFYSGSFPANRSNALSSIFELNQKEGNKEKAKFRMSVGATEVSASADGPVGKKSSYLFSIRRSYLQFLFSALKLPFLPTFNDYQLKWKTQFNTKNELSIISVGSLDQFKLNTGLQNPTVEQQYILDYLPVNNQWSYTIGAVYKHFGKKSLKTLVISRNMLNNVAYKYPNNDETTEKIYDYNSQEIENKVRYEESYLLKNDFKLGYSLSSQYVKYSNATDQKIYLENQVQQINYSSLIDFFRWGASAQVSKNFLEERLAASFGIRTDANNYSKSMQNMLDQLSPRFSLKYSLTTKLSLTGSIGKYFRLPAYTSLGYRDSTGVLVNKDNGIKYISVVHYIAGMEYDMKENIVFSIEGFYKDYHNYPFSLRDSISLATKGSDFGVIGDEPIASIGRGRAYGFEFLNRTRISNKLNFIFAYTFVRSEFKDKHGNYVPTSWDSRNIISTLVTYNLRKNWSVGAKWRFSGGLPYTPYDLELSSEKQAWDLKGQAYPDYNQVNSERLNSFNQLDIRIDKKYFFQRWSLMLYLDIENVLNYQAQQPDYYVREKDANGNYITVDNGTKYVLVPIENSSGTILPAVGIMIEF